MKKTILTCLAFVAISLCLFVSCNAEQALPDEADALAYIRFGENSRGLSADYTAEKYDNLYWFYTAEKTDGRGTTGQTTTSTDTVTLPTSEKKAVPVVGTTSAPGKGLKLDSSVNNGYLGPFSQGDWKFGLYAYKCSDSSWNNNNNATLVYSSENITYTLMGGESRSIAVEVKPEGKTGIVVFNNAYFRYKDSGEKAPDLTLTLTHSAGNDTNDSNNYTFSTKYTADDTENKQYQLKLTKDTTDSSKYNISFANTNNKAELPVGTDGTAVYECKATVSFSAEDNGSSSTKTFTEVTQTFYFAVYSGGATTTISGDLIEDPTANWKFDVTEYTLKKVSLSDLESGVEVGNAALKFSGIATETEKSTSYFVDISESNKQVTKDSFVVSDEEGVEGAVNKVYNITLKDEDGKEVDLKKTLGDSVKVTAVLKVDKGLNGGSDFWTTGKSKPTNHSHTNTAYSTDSSTGCSVKVEYNGDSSKDQPEVIAYCADTGELTMTTTHFSEFVVIETSKLPVSVTKDSTTKYYAILENAFKNAETGSEIKLLNNIELKEDIAANKNVTLDLNDKTVTYGEYKIVVGKETTLTVVSKNDPSALIVGVKGTVDGNKYPYTHAFASNSKGCYNTLGEAVSNSENTDTINLLDNVTETKTITVASEKDLVIKLNGHTVTFKNDDAPITTAVNNQGTLNINNGTLEYSSTLKQNESTKNRTIISNNGSLKTINLTVTGKITADYNIALSADIQSQISNDNTCPTVALLNNSGSASIDNSTLTLNVNLPTSSASPVSDNNFAGAKPIVVYQGAGASTEIRNGSTLSSTTSVPGGVIGLYVLVFDNNTSDSTATISDSTINVSNSSYGWTRPVFAESRNADRGASVKVTKSSITSDNSLTNSTISTAGLADKINASNNLVYGLRAKGNSVIYVDNPTEVDVTPGEGKKITYAGENGTHTQDSATDIYGQIINSSTGKAITVKTSDYSSFADAMKYAPEGSTVVLDGNASISETIELGKNLTLDLGGKTLSSTERAFLVHKGILTLQNGTLETTIAETAASGKVDTGKSAIRVDCTEGNAGVTLLKSAAINAKNCYGITAFGTGNYTATLDISGKINSANACLAGNGGNDSIANATDITVNINVKDGAVLTQGGEGYTLDSSKSDPIDPVAVYKPNYAGTLTISGGTITSVNGSAVEIRAGKAVISGGTLTSNANSYSCERNDSGPTVVGAAVAVSQHTTKKDIDVTINGGTFVGQRKLAVVNTLAADNDAGSTDRVKVTVDSSAGINDTEIDGIKVGDDTYYPTLESAVKNATEGQTIKLLSDLDLTYYKKSAAKEFSFRKNITLDVNSKKVTTNNYGVYYKGDGLTIENGTFEVKDVEKTTEPVGVGSYALFIGSHEKSAIETDRDYKASLRNVTCTGGINVSAHKIELDKCTISGTHYYAIWSQNSGKITINSGTYTSAPSNEGKSVLNTQSEIIINGGNFKSTVKDVTMFAINEDTEKSGQTITFHELGKITVNSGDFEYTSLCKETEGTKVTAETLIINGGVFSSDPKTYVPDTSSVEANSQATPTTWTVTEKN